MSSKLFSQTQFVDGKDTLTCFTTNQSKFLLKSYYRSIELDTILKLSYEQIFSLNKIISKQKNIISNDSIIINNKNAVIGLQNIEKESLISQIKESEKQVNRQKKQKKFIVLFGVMLTTYLIIK